MSAGSSFQSSVSVAVWVRTGYVQNEAPQLCPRPCLRSFCIYICKGLQGGSAVTLLLSLHPLPSPSLLKYQIWIVCLHFEPKKLTLATIPALLLILTEFQMTVIVHSPALCLMSGGKWLTNGTLLLTMLLFCKLCLKILSFALTFSKHKNWQSSLYAGNSACHGVQHCLPGFLNPLSVCTCLSIVLRRVNSCDTYKRQQHRNNNNCKI